MGQDAVGGSQYSPELGLRIHRNNPNLPQYSKDKTSTPYPEGACESKRSSPRMRLSTVSEKGNEMFTN